MGHAKSTIVLCEDESQWLFVYRWLLARGLGAGDLRLVPYPAGRGSGTRHVISKYPDEMQEYRNKANQVGSRKLIVVVDADVVSVADRLSALDASLVAGGHTQRATAERVCLLVPKRNLETWLHFFHGQPVDETADFHALYQGDAKAPACKLAGPAFEKWLRGDSASPATPSLVTARSEAARL